MKSGSVTCGERNFLSGLSTEILRGSFTRHLTNASILTHAFSMSTSPYKFDALFGQTHLLNALLKVIMACFTGLLIIWVIWFPFVRVFVFMFVFANMY